MLYKVLSRIFLQVWYAITAHYSKSQIFVQKFNFDHFDKTPTFSRGFSPKFFFDNISREIKVVNS